nr:SDR family oxidoreductase [Paracoccus suum]
MEPRPDLGETSYRGTGRLTGKRALITGGDSGIGAAVAIAFAREGADVAISYLPAEEEDARKIITLIEAEGRKAVALPADIREEEACNKLVADAVAGLGGLEILVNNAGRQQWCDSIEDLSTEDFDATFKTNCYAPFWITKAALKHLKSGASIIITSSVQGFSPSETLFDYAQTKAANRAFAQSLAKQLAPKGIRVNAVCPGPFWTVLQTSGGQPREKYMEHGADTPLGRPGMPVEIAPIYVLLASDEASYITGEYYGAVGGRGL